MAREIESRIGTLDGRHPETGDKVRTRIAAVLTPDGRLFIDSGDALREVQVEEARLNLFDSACIREVTVACSPRSPKPIDFRDSG